MTDDQPTPLLDLPGSERLRQNRERNTDAPPPIRWCTHCHALHPRGEHQNGAAF